MSLLLYPQLPLSFSFFPACKCLFQFWQSKYEYLNVFNKTALFQNYSIALASPTKTITGPPFPALPCFVWRNWNFISFLGLCPGALWPTTLTKDERISRSSPDLSTQASVVKMLPVCKRCQKEVQYFFLMQPPYVIWKRCPRLGLIYPVYVTLRILPTPKNRG